jgi:hypothetical protein
MYYFENVPLSQIAACFGLTESEITRIRAKTVHDSAIINAGAGVQEFGLMSVIRDN